MINMVVGRKMFMTQYRKSNVQNYTKYSMIRTIARLTFKKQKWGYFRGLD